jgi:hypothetical protein
MERLDHLDGILYILQNVKKTSEQFNSQSGASSPSRIDMDINMKYVDFTMSQLYVKSDNWWSNGSL